MNEVPQNPLLRAARLASLPAAYAGRTAWGLGKRVGGRPAEIVAAELQARTAAQLFQVLGELKGGAMKFGQALSIFESALPEEVAAPYRAMLTKLQDSAPSLPARSVHQVMREQFGDHWRDLFEFFDDQASAAASIGQVHRATWSDGRQVAVKIQYPGAGKALLSDLNQISRVARVATAWIPGIEIGPLLDELKARMAEELDYHLEAAAQEAFAEEFAGDPGVFVPHVLAHSERVLVSEWIEGTPLSQIIAHGSQQQRDQVAQLYLDFLLTGPSRVGILHADPHPGNFRLTPEGRLGVMDFGAHDNLPDGLPAEMGRLLTLAIEGDADAVVTGLRETGFVREGMQVDAVRLLEYLEPFIAPLRSDTFHFTRSWLRGVSAHINDPTKPTYDMAMRLNLPPEYLLIHRVWGGGIGVLCQIGGVVAGRAAVNRSIPGADLPPLSA